MVTKSQKKRQNHKKTGMPMAPKGARSSEVGSTGPPGARCRVAPQSQIHIGTNSKNTIFALFWPENASN